MARQWRIEYEGALYHVLSRGNEQRDIFLEDKDRHCFLDVLGEMSERFTVDIFAYVLMDICPINRSMSCPSSGKYSTTPNPE
ncbi:MAG: hypothetical protein ABII68_04670 [Pseudomonadota bacterium]